VRFLVAGVISNCISKTELTVRFSEYKIEEILLSLCLAILEPSIMTVHRTTLFKLTTDADIEAALAAYTKLAANNSKNGKPYILSSKAYKLHPDPRSQGFTLAAQTTFSSVEDMKYYDEECEAHKELKGVVGPKQQGILMVYGEE